MILPVTTNAVMMMDHVNVLKAIQEMIVTFVIQVIMYQLQSMVKILAQVMKNLLKM